MIESSDRSPWRRKNHVSQVANHTIQKFCSKEKFARWRYKFLLTRVTHDFAFCELDLLIFRAPWADMSDLVLLLSGVLSLLVILLVGLIVWKGKSTSKATSEKKKTASGAVPRNREDGLPRRAVKKNVPKKDHDSDEDSDYDPLADEIALPEGKIGAKKRAKLEAKAAKRAEREAELQEREERKERQAMIEEERKKKEEQLAELEKQREEEERIIKEEKEKKEFEEYLAMKANFAIEEEGYDEEVNEDEATNRLQMFIDYVKSQKVVLLEDLAGHFKMKTQDVINRIQDLMSQKILVGVIDDRGKFIHITMEELESVAKFMKRRGRVSISDLVENSNRLINLKPETVFKKT